MSDSSQPLDAVDDVFSRFQRVLVEVLSVSPDQLHPGANIIDDLDASSLDLVEAVMAVEDEFGISVPEDELKSIETVRQAFTVLRSHLQGDSAPQALHNS